MTRRELERIVRWWIPRLGLEHWDITVVWDDWDSGNAHASVWRSNDYEVARVYFNPDTAPEWARLESHLHVTHELLHLVTRDVEQVLDLTDGLLGQEAHRILTEAHKHALEGAVDRLSHRIVKLAGITAA